jgi:16S rRNA (uracil1498-N3)-methyltransferase
LKIPRFYCSDIHVGRVVLGQSESHHLVHTLRLSSGRKVELFDGDGAVASAVVDSAGRKSVTLSVEQAQAHPPRTTGRVVIAAGIARGQRFDHLITQCTELGVDAVLPVVFERTVKLAAGGSVLQRYRKLAISAAKQCGRIFLPTITEPKTLPEAIRYIGQLYPESQIIYGGFGDCAGSICELPVKDADVAAFIGPEGGMTPEEEGLLNSLGAAVVTLTQTTLRVETAAMSMAAVLCVSRDQRHASNDRRPDSHGGKR